MNKPHNHAEYIKAKADGKTIQESAADIDVWIDMDDDDWVFAENRKYRIKPEPPKYPQTRMSRQEIKRAFHAEDGETGKGWRGIANAAIARAIEDGDVFTRAATSQAIDLATQQAQMHMVPAAMLENVAHAVKCKAIAAIDAHGNHVRDMYGLGGARFDVTRLDLPAIIASVRNMK